MMWNFNIKGKKKFIVLFPSYRINDIIFTTHVNWTMFLVFKDIRKLVDWLFLCNLKIFNIFFIQNNWSKYYVLIIKHIFCWSIIFGVYNWTRNSFRIIINWSRKEVICQPCTLNNFRHSRHQIVIINFSLHSIMLTAVMLLCVIQWPTYSCSIIRR